MPGRLRRWLGVVDPAAAALSLLLGAFLVVGESFNATDSAAWFASSPGAAAGSLVALAGIAVVLYLPLALLLRRLARPGPAAPAADTAVMPMTVALRRWLLPGTAVILLGWLPWLLLHFPGAFEADTVTQLLQAEGYLPRSNHHPWFDTVVFGWFFDLGHLLGGYQWGLLLFLLVQEVLTAVGLAAALAYLGRLGLPRGPRRVLTLLVAFFPVFVMAPALMSKDSFAAIFWTPFLVLFVETVRTRGRVMMRPGVAALALGLAVPLTLAKQTNVYLLVLTAACAIAVATPRARLRLAGGTLVALVITNVLWAHVALPAMHVEKGSTREMLSLPLQQTARTARDHGDSLPASEKAAIDRVRPFPPLAGAYDPRKADSVKGRWNDDASRGDVAAYARTWFVEGLRYPGTYAAATINMVFPLLAPTAPVLFLGDVDTSVYLENWMANRTPGTTQADFEEVITDLRPSPGLEAPRTALDRCFTAFVSRTPVASTAFYGTWLPLFALAFARRRRSWLHAVALVPLFVNLGFLVAGPVVTVRYMIPLLYGSVVIVGLMMTPARMQRR